MTTELRGITWNHTRGFVPMVATAQRFEELNPGVSIRWEKRSLQAFADAPLAELVQRFDLLVIDHPSIGEAATRGLLLPLDAYLDPLFLADQAANSVGQSRLSYQYNGRQWALATDAATPIAGFRPDLIPRQELPPTWSELVRLARAGRVAVPGLAIDALMAFFMVANALGAEPFAEAHSVIAPARRPAAEEALDLLRELLALSAPGSLQRNPIQTWQLLAASDTVCYCPFAYGYSNYARSGYAQHRLGASGLVSLNDGTPLRSTLGGAGVAISAHCQAPEVAAEYARFVACSDTQRTLYTASGGQPGYRAAWLDGENNRITQDYFANTLKTLDEAWVRPRWPGFIAFQDEASAAIHRFLCDPVLQPAATLAEFETAFLRHHEEQA